VGAPHIARIAAPEVATKDDAMIRPACLMTCRRPSGVAALWLIPPLIAAAFSAWAADDVETVPADRLEGDWRGAIYCKGRAFPIAFEIEDEGEGRISVEARIGGEVGGRYESPFPTPQNEASLVGKYSPRLARFELASENSPEQRRIGIDGLIDPESGDMALNIAQYQGRRLAYACDHGFARKDARADLVDAFLERVAALSKGRRAIETDRCRPALAEWMAAADGVSGGRRLDMRAEGLKLAETATFEPLFGAPLARIEADDLRRMGAELRMRCDGGAPASQALRYGLAGLLDESGGFQRAVHHAEGVAVLRGWAKAMERRLAADVSLDVGETSGILITARAFARPSAPDLLKPLNAAVAAWQARQARYARIAAVKAEVDAAASDFVALMVLAGAAAGMPADEAALIEAGLAANFRAAAERYVQTAETPEAATYMWAWSRAPGETPACVVVGRDACEDVADDFEDRAEDLAEDFAEAELDAYEEVLDGKTALETLAAVVADERRYRETYGGLAGVEAMAEAQEERDDGRRDLQEDLDDELEDAVRAATTAPELQKLLAAYFLDGDLDDDDMDDVLDAVRERQAASTPFVGLPGADYLNALYNNDLAALRELDARYVAGFKPLAALYAQQVIQMGPLVDALLGRRQGRTAADARTGYATLSIIAPVAGVYLLEYQDRFEACLKPDARVFTVTRSADRVTTRGSFEIERVRLWTTKDEYRVNPEFFDIFRQVWNTDLNSSGARMLEYFVNDGRISRVADGVRKMMATWDCDAPEIRQFEQNLAAYFRKNVR